MGYPYTRKNCGSSQRQRQKSGKIYERYHLYEDPESFSNVEKDFKVAGISHDKEGCDDDVSPESSFNVEKKFQVEGISHVYLGESTTAEYIQWCISIPHRLMQNGYTIEVSSCST